MSLETLLRRPVTIHRLDASHAVVETFDTGCYLEPMSELMPDSMEPWVIAEETYRSTWLLFLPAGTRLGAADRVVVLAPDVALGYSGADAPEEFDVVDVRRMFNPRTQVEHHLEATVTRLAPPDMLMTVLRPIATVDAYSGAPDPEVVGSSVRVWVTPVTGLESTTGSQETVLLTFRCDPVDVRHYDRLRDETTGTMYEVVWAIPKGVAAGRAHVEGELRLVEGAT